MTEQEAIEAELIQRELSTREQSQETPTSDEKVGGFLGIGAIPKQDFEAGERNVLGNIFDRPGAAIRSALQGKGYVEGATNPTNVPKFQDQWLDNYYSMVGKQMSNMAPLEANIHNAIMSIPGLAISAAGLAADVATNPADVLGMLVGKSPAKSFSETGIAKKDVGSLLKYETNLKQAGKTKVALDTVRDTLGKAKSLAIQEVADVPTDLKFNTLSQRVVNAIKDPLYQVNFTPEGGVEQTVGNLDKVAEAVGDLIHSPKVWEEAPNKELAMIKKFYGETREAMKKAAKSVGKPIDQSLEDYHKFMGNYNLINKKIQDSAGNAMGNKLKTVFRLGAEPAYKEAFKEVSKISPEVKDVMKSMQHRGLLKDLLKIGSAGLLLERAAYVGRRITSGESQ